MKLVITTPLSVIVEADGVRGIRAEDETGAFGILATLLWRKRIGLECVQALGLWLLRLSLELGDAPGQLL